MFIIENFKTGREISVATLEEARAIQNAMWEADPCLSGWTGIWSPERKLI